MTRHEWTSPNLMPHDVPRPRRPRRSPRPKNANTPGLGGYVLAVLLACWFAGTWIYVGLVVGLVIEDRTLDDAGTAVLAAPLYVPGLAIAAATYGFPVAVAGVLVVHVALRHVPDQRAHVVLAGVAGTVFCAVYLHLTDFELFSRVLVASCVGVAAAAGRVAVLPLVESRRRLVAQGRLTGNVP